MSRANGSSKLYMWILEKQLFSNDKKFFPGNSESFSSFSNFGFSGQGFLAFSNEVRKGQRNYCFIQQKYTALFEEGGEKN